MRQPLNLDLQSHNLKDELCGAARLTRAASSHPLATPDQTCRPESAKVQLLAILLNTLYSYHSFLCRASAFLQTLSSLHGVSVMLVLHRPNTVLCSRP